MYGAEHLYTHCSHENQETQVFIFGIARAIVAQGLSEGRENAIIDGETKQLTSITNTSTWSHGPRNPQRKLQHISIIIFVIPS